MRKPGQPLFFNNPGDPQLRQKNPIPIPISIAISILNRAFAVLPGEYAVLHGMLKTETLAIAFFAVYFSAEFLRKLVMIGKTRCGGINPCH